MKKHNALFSHVQTLQTQVGSYNSDDNYNTTHSLWKILLMKITQEPNKRRLCTIFQMV